MDRAEAAIASTRAQLVQAQANLDQAQRSYDRSAAMKKINPQLIADEEVEKLRTAVDVNKALVESNKHAVDQALASLNDAEERAGQDDDLRADGGPRDAPRRRAG